MELAESGAFVASIIPHYAKLHAGYSLLAVLAKYA